jgi:hypothetical protein
VSTVVFFFRENGKEIDKKLKRFQVQLGTTHRTLKNKARKGTGLKFYKPMTVPALLHGSETWVPTKKIQSRIQSAEMNFLRKTRGCTKLNCVRNETVRAEVNMFHIIDVIERYRSSWLQHINRMQDTRLPKKAFQYRPSGKGDLERPKKRWRDIL